MMIASNTQETKVDKQKIGFPTTLRKGKREFFCKTFFLFLFPTDLLLHSQRAFRHDSMRAATATALAATSDGPVAPAFSKTQVQGSDGSAAYMGLRATTRYTKLE